MEMVDLEKFYETVKLEALIHTEKSPCLLAETQRTAFLLGAELTNNRNATAAIDFLLKFMALKDIRKHIEQLSAELDEALAEMFDLIEEYEESEGNDAKEE